MNTHLLSLITKSALFLGLSFQSNASEPAPAKTAIKESKSYGLIEEWGYRKITDWHNHLATTEDVRVLPVGVSSITTFNRDRIIA